MSRPAILRCFILLLPAAAGAVTVSGEDLARCAAIASRDMRLACYDALAHRAPDLALAPASAAAAPAPPAPVAPAASVVSAAVAPASAPVAAPDDPKSFGLSAAQRHVAVVGPKEESGRIVSLVGNQAGHSTFVLDNGQMWAVLDDDGWLSNGDQVRIKRATLGSFLLTAPSHHTYHVHRIQ